MVMIEVTGLTYHYPLSHNPALKDINLQIEAGQFVAVIGANGAGKSTLCLVLSGLIPSLFNGKMLGSVTINGMNTRNHTAGEFAGRVGLVLQNPANQLSEMRYTVFEEVAFGLENLGVSPSEMPERIEHVLRLTGLFELRDRFPFTLSGGQRQRLALASMLVLEPPVLLLDEPTAMLDPQGSKEVFHIIQTLTTKNTTVVITEHNLEWIAQTADRVIALNKGSIVLDGKPEFVLASPLLETFGIDYLRYTQAARESQIYGLWPSKRPLPVTLEQSVLGFNRVSSIKKGGGRK